MLRYKEQTTSTHGVSTDYDVPPDKICGICHEGLKPHFGKPNACVHKFCYTCISEWNKKHKICPYCRTPYTKIIQREIKPHKFEFRSEAEENRFWSFRGISPFDINYARKDSPDGLILSTVEFFFKGTCLTCFKPLSLGGPFDRCRKCTQPSHRNCLKDDDTDTLCCLKCLSKPQ